MSDNSHLLPEVCRCGLPVTPGYGSRCEDCWAEDHRYYGKEYGRAVGNLSEVSNQGAVGRLPRFGRRENRRPFTDREGFSRGY